MASINASMQYPSLLLISSRIRVFRCMHLYGKKENRNVIKAVFIKLQLTCPSAWLQSGGTNIWLEDFWLNLPVRYHNTSYYYPIHVYRLKGQLISLYREPNMELLSLSLSLSLHLSALPPSLFLFLYFCSLPFSPIFLLAFFSCTLFFYLTLLLISLLHPFLHISIPLSLTLSLSLFLTLSY